MKAMRKHRSHSVAFKCRVAQEFVAGETVHGFSKRHDASRQLIRIWVGKYESGALDDVQAEVVSHDRYVTFQMAEVAVSRQMFKEILMLIAQLRAPPAPA
jgi:transposase